MRKHPQPAPLSRTHRYAVYGTAFALLLSGVGWLICRYLLREGGELADFPHVFEPLWLKLHGALAMVSLLVIGTLFPWHAWRAWKIRRNVSTGLTIGVALLMLIVTGWGLYYVGSEALHPWLSVIHWGIGLAWVPALALHVIIGRRQTAAMQHAHSHHHRRKADRSTAVG